LRRSAPPWSSLPRPRWGGRPSRRTTISRRVPPGEPEDPEQPHRSPPITTASETPLPRQLRIYPKCRAAAILPSSALVSDRRTGKKATKRALRRWLRSPAIKLCQAYAPRVMATRLHLRHGPPISTAPAINSTCKAPTSCPPCWRKVHEAKLAGAQEVVVWEPAPRAASSLHVQRSGARLPLPPGALRLAGDREHRRRRGMSPSASCVAELVCEAVRLPRRLTSIPPSPTAPRESSSTVTRIPSPRLARRNPPARRHPQHIRVVPQPGAVKFVSGPGTNPKTFTAASLSFLFVTFRFPSVELRFPPPCSAAPAPFNQSP